MKIVVAVLSVLLAPSLAIAQEKFFDSNGVQIHYIEQGTGEPIVLVHGQGGSAHSWIDNGVFENLSRDHRVVALDCRGHGLSGKPHDPRQYGREMALDVTRLLDHLQISRAHIIGYSMGAQLTGLLLTLSPNRFITATLGGGTGRFQWTDRDDRIAEQEAQEFEQTGISPTLIRELAPPNASPDVAARASGQDVQRRAQAVTPRDNDQLAIAALTRSRHDQAITPKQVAAITVPTLGVVGSLDPALSQFKAMKELRPAMKLVVIDGATHGGATARPEFVGAVRDFLSPYEHKQR